MNYNSINTKNTKIFGLIIVLFIIIFSNFCYAQELLSLDLITILGNTKDNSFYLSKYNTKDLFYEINVNYDKLDVGYIKDPRIQIETTLLSDNSNIEVNPSFRMLKFNNSFTKDLIIMSKTYDFTKSTYLKIKIDLFDEYDNLLDSKIEYLKLIPTNSKFYFPETKKNKVAKLRSYSLERSFIIFNNDKLNSDVIRIYSDYNNPYFTLDVFCEMDDNLSYSTQYISKDIRDLNVFIKEDKILTNDDYVLKCRLQDKYNSYNLSEINVKVYDNNSNFLDGNSALNSEVDLNSSDDTNKNSLTALINLKDIDLDLRSILFIGIIFMLIAMLFFEDKSL